MRRLSQTAGRDLLSAIEQRAYFAEHLSDALVINDLAARNASWTAGRNGGWLSVNEIREAENRNAVPGGDTYLQPLNMTEIGAAGADAPADDETAGGDDAAVGDA